MFNKKRTEAIKAFDIKKDQARVLIQQERKRLQKINQKMEGP